MNILIRNALSILPDEVKVCSVYIKDGIIASVDKEPEGFKAEKIIDGTGRLLVPGFVNAHTHMYMSCLRNCANDLAFMPWLFENVIPLENQLTHDDARWGILLSCMEMLSGGITSVLDMHMFPSTTPAALKEAGMRAVVSRGLQGDKDSREGGEMRIEQAVAEMKEFKDVPTLSFMLAPHAPYTCDDVYMKEIAKKAKELGVGIHTHLSESVDEQNTIRERYGCTPTELLDDCGLLSENTVCAHCVQLSESDMELFAKRGVSVVHNISSNLKLGNGFAPIEKMMEHGINVALGTDGCCSNNNQSILKEMQMTALVHKGTSLNPTSVKASEVFDMATVNGAKAMGLEGKVGEIKPGMAADLSLYDLDFPGFFPMREPKSALCYSSAGLRAETVLVNGEVLMEKGEYKTIDADRVRFEINALSKRLNK